MSREQVRPRQVGPPPWELKWHPDALSEARQLGDGGIDQVREQVHVMAYLVHKLDQLQAWPADDEHPLFASDLRVRTCECGDRSAHEVDIGKPGSEELRIVFWSHRGSSTLWVLGVDSLPISRAEALVEYLMRSRKHELGRRLDWVRGTIQDDGDKL